MSRGSSIQVLRRVRLFLGLPGWLAVAAIVGWNLARLASPYYAFGPLLQDGMLVACMSAMALFALSLVGLFVLRVRCPSCKELFFEGTPHPYFLKAPFAILFMHKCCHCGLSIGNVGAPPPNPSLERP